MTRAQRSALQVVEQPRRSVPLPTETPRSRFKRIAPDRLGKVIKAIDHLKQLSNTAVYDARPGEKEQLVEVIRSKADELAFVLDHPGKAPPILTFEDEAPE